MSKKTSYFYCYNKNVSDFLNEEGVKFITVARDLKTEKVFSLYEINSELQEALDKYKNR